MAQAHHPEPGFGYKIRDYLGGGNWKSAYRATSPYLLSDVAILFFHEDNPDVMAKDVSSLIRTLSEHPFSSYLAEFYSIQKNQDGKVFIVEELLAKPLEGVSPLNDVVRFIQIARDLSRALCCLHSAGLVHRDLKLDNCGLDHHHKAKIFDLGSVTSEGGSVRGTIFTRAPELMLSNNESAQHDSAADVWGLGALLFALRCGEYPFVYNSEVQERQVINRKVRAKELSTSEATAAKDQLDLRVKERMKESGAETAMRERVHSMLRGRTEEILISMLSFDKEKRKQVSEYESEWSKLAQDFAQGQRSNAGSKWEKIKRDLEKVDRKDFLMTLSQIERIIAESKREEVKDDDLDSILLRIKNDLLSRGQRYQLDEIAMQEG